MNKNIPCSYKRVKKDRDGEERDPEVRESGVKGLVEKIREREGEKDKEK